MDTFGIILMYFFINGVISLLVSVLFEDRKIGMWGVFGISIILSPFVGVIFGLSSPKITPESTDKIFHDEKEKILKQIELMTREEELGLLDEEGKQRLLQLKRDYISMKKNETIINPHEN